MQRLSHYLPCLSRTSILSSASPLKATSKFPLPFSSLGVSARLISSRPPPPMSQHIGNVVTKEVSSPVHPEFTPEQKWANRSKINLQNAINSPPADAYAGRSVKNTGNLALTFRALNEILVRNKVRQTIRMTERHEKKGAKRRRLQSERWRKQFSNEVRKKVQLVMKIRDRGA